MLHSVTWSFGVWRIRFEFSDKVIGPFRPELKAKPSDERLFELEQFVYNLVGADPELRKVLLDEYERKAQYLNFELVR